MFIREGQDNGIIESNDNIIDLALYHIGKVHTQKIIFWKVDCIQDEIGEGQDKAWEGVRPGNGKRVKCKKTGINEEAQKKNFLFYS